MALQQKSRKLPARVPRADKRIAGATDIYGTPMHIRVAGVQLDPKEKRALRARLGRQLERFAPHVTEIAVRFEDLNGPRGGVDTVCRIAISATGMGRLVVESHDVDAKGAARKATRQAKVALSRALEREGRTTPRAKARRGDGIGRRHHAPPPPRPEGGSLIGRRVGRSRANLLRAAERPEKERRDAWTDTSLPGVSASDRKAGGGSTAARNTRLRARRAAVTLEDSATKPSRKSTRKSANRQKAGSKQGRREKRKLHAPSSRARRG
jgi:hypothetical protein